MNNILFILIDCLDYTKIGNNRNRLSPTPFIDSLKEKGYWVESMFSQAPYTEAALNATMCGHDTLDFGGYLKRYKNEPETLFEMAQRGGYEVYAQMWPHIHPTSALRGIDHLCLRPYSFNTLWCYRLVYYRDLFFKKELANSDWLDIIELMDDNFTFWQSYYQMLINGDQQVETIKSYSKLPNIHDDLKILNKEINIYLQNKHSYIENLFILGTSHQLFTLYSSELLTNKVHDRSIIEKATNLFTYSIKRAHKMNRNLNLRNTKLSYNEMRILWKQSQAPWKIWTRTPFSQYLRNYYSLIMNQSLADQANGSYDMQKDSLSLKKWYDVFSEWYEKRNTDKPFFAYIHTEDIHGNPMLFDHCSSSISSLKQQHTRLSAYLDKIPRNYKGNLAYDLGLLNIDYQLEQIFVRLNKSGLLKNTTIVITSDHGCGTNYNPLRGPIQNFNEECYHVPYIMIGNNIKPGIDKELRLTKDILPTLAGYIGVSPECHSTGKDILSQEGYECIVQEYMGPGCPDMNRRKIWMCAFDRKWKVFVKIGLNTPFSQREICSIYNLKQDPNEINNLVFDNKSIADAGYLLSKIELRWNDIKRNHLNN